jgi:hypothetical protein
MFKTNWLKSGSDLRAFEQCWRKQMWKTDTKSDSLEAKNTFVKNGCEDCCIKVKSLMWYKIKTHVWSLSNLVDKTCVTTNIVII